MTHATLRPEFEDLIDPYAPVGQLGTGFTFTEGPIWHPVGHYLLFSDMPADVRRRWDTARGVVGVAAAVLTMMLIQPVVMVLLYLAILGGGLTERSADPQAIARPRGVGAVSPAATRSGSCRSRSEASRRAGP